MPKGLAKHSSPGRYVKETFVLAVLLHPLLYGKLRLCMRPLRLLQQRVQKPLYLRARGNAAVIGDCLTRRNFAPGEPGSQYGRPLRGLPITAALVARKERAA